MTKKTIYLSGPIDGHTVGEANSWRAAAETRLAEVGFKTLNPMRGKTHLFDSDQLITPSSTACIDSDLTKDSVIVVRDETDVDIAAALLVQVGMNPSKPIQPMTGTPIEVYRAARFYRTPKPCIAFVAEGLHVHPQFYSPWFGQFMLPSYRVHDTLMDAIDFILEVL